MCGYRADGRTGLPVPETGTGWTAVADTICAEDMDDRACSALSFEAWSCQVHVHHHICSLCKRSIIATITTTAALVYYGF